MKEKRREIARRKHEAAAATRDAEVAPTQNLSAAVLQLEREKVRRLEVSQLGDVAIATAAGAALIGGVFSETGAILGALAGAVGGIALRLASRHS